MPRSLSAFAEAHIATRPLIARLAPVRPVRPWRRRRLFPARKWFALTHPKLEHSTVRNTKHNFVLVHGAWHGGWVWQDLIATLRDQGHVATGPTLTGLGERRQVGNATADLSTHITDVVDHIEMENLTDVTLVGWSYGGMVIAGAASQIAARVKSLIYLDAIIPDDGKALVDYLPEESVGIFDQFKLEDAAIPPPPLETINMVLDGARHDFTQRRLVSQPWRTFFEPVNTSPPGEVHRTAYLYCSRFGPTLFTQFFENMLGNPAVRAQDMDTGHAPMLTATEETAERLVDLA